MGDNNGEEILMNEIIDMNTSPASDLQRRITLALSNTLRSLGYEIEGLDMTLRPIPIEGTWGFGSAIAFQLLKGGIGSNPRELAERITAATPKLSEVERVEAVNGYVNFYVDRNWYANQVVGQVLSRRELYGCSPKRGERVMVEYANLNTHKAMHVGHLRNVVLGASILNILRCAGFDTVSATYLGDIGMHVIKVLWAYRNLYEHQEPPTGKGTWLEKLYVEATARLEFRNEVVKLIEKARQANPNLASQLSRALDGIAKSNDENSVSGSQLAKTINSGEEIDWKAIVATNDSLVFPLWKELGRVLVDEPSTMGQPDAIEQQMVNDDERTVILNLRDDYSRLNSNWDWWEKVPAWRAEIKEMFSLWESQEPTLIELWQTTRQWSLEMFERIFGDLGVKFDVWFFESEVEEPGKLVVEELIKMGIAEDHRTEGCKLRLSSRHDSGVKSGIVG
jgi:arginyl-tRNA synthetase